MEVLHSLYTVCPQKSVTLTISENIPKPQNKFWNFFNCTDTPNPWPKHTFVGNILYAVHTLVTHMSALASCADQLNCSLSRIWNYLSNYEGSANTLYSGLNLDLKIVGQMVPIYCTLRAGTRDRRISSNKLLWNTFLFSSMWSRSIGWV